MRTSFLAALALLTLLALGAGLPPAQGQPIDGGWLPGLQSTGPITLDGQVEIPRDGARMAADEPFLVSGWVVDVTAEGWAGIDEIRLYAGGMTEEDAAPLATAQIARDRPDVATRLGNPFWMASGFAATVPGSAFGPGTGELRVYVHTPARGWWYRSVTLNFTTPPGRGSPRFNTPVLTAGFILAGQLALGPIVATLVPPFRRIYLARWGQATLVQALLAGAGLLFVATQWRLP